MIPQKDEPSNTLCVDASLWVRWLTPEAGSKEIEKKFLQWLEEYDFFIAPSFLIFEVTSAIRKKYFRKEISIEKAKEGMEKFFRLPIILYQSFEVLSKTWELAHQMGETVLYDVSYLALSDWKKVSFWTADGKFYKKARIFYSDSHFIE